MPVTKRRPNISELLDTAVKQKKELERTNFEILERPASIWLKSFGNSGSKVYVANDDSDSDSDDDLEASPNSYFRHMPSFDRRRIQRKFKSFLSEMALHNLPAPVYAVIIKTSRKCKTLLGYSVVRVFRALLALFAFVVLAFSASYESKPDIVYEVDALDKAVNSIFLLDAVLRIISTPISIRIEEAFQREVKWTKVLSESGLIDLIIALICFSLAMNQSGLWFRLIRSISLSQTFLDLFPHISILMSGIMEGLKSIAFTILLLFLIILPYASLGYSFFRRNDPYHFGTYGLSVLSFFQLSTFEDSSAILNVNFFGCDNFSSLYQSLSNFTVRDVRTSWGTFNIEPCSNPQAQPFLATIIFVTYTLISGYVIVSMALATVAIGINEKLEALRNQDLYGNDKEEAEALAAAKKKTVPGSKGGDRKASLLLGVSGETKILKKMLHKIWGEDDDYSSETHVTIEHNFLKIRSFHNLVLNIKTIVSHDYYQLMISGIITLVAIVQIVNSSDGDSSETDDVHLAFQIILSIDSLLVIVSNINTPKELADFWKVFDIVLTSLMWLPMSDLQNSSLKFLEFLRILRLLRVMKTFIYITDLRVMLTAISNSIYSILYVASIIALFFFYFAIAGILLFKNSDPSHFMGMTPALKTLLQVMTLDNWSEVMKTSMFGCKYHGYSTGLIGYDSLCDVSLGSGKGWLSPLYFIVFIILSAMVLVSLLVGVIITSMELLREGATEEDEIWEKVNIIRKRYVLNDHIVDLLLELFEKVDKEGNGILTFAELQPIMNVVAMSEANQFEFFMRVDTDGSGQIDFSEFCEMIMLIGLSHEANKEKGKGHVSKRFNKIMASGGEAAAILNQTGGMVPKVAKVLAQQNDGKNLPAFQEGQKQHNSLHSASKVLEELQFFERIVNDSVVDSIEKSNSSDSENEIDKATIKNTRMNSVKLMSSIKPEMGTDTKINFKKSEKDFQLEDAVSNKQDEITPFQSVSNRLHTFEIESDSVADFEDASKVHESESYQDEKHSRPLTSPEKSRMTLMYPESSEHIEISDNRNKKSEGFEIFKVLYEEESSEKIFIASDRTNDLTSETNNCEVLEDFVENV